MTCVGGDDEGRARPFARCQGLSTAWAHGGGAWSLLPRAAQQPAAQPYGRERPAAHPAWAHGVGFRQLLRGCARAHRRSCRRGFSEAAGRGVHQRPRHRLRHRSVPPRHTSRRSPHCPRTRPCGAATARRIGWCGADAHQCQPGQWSGGDGCWHRCGHRARRRTPAPQRRRAFAARANPAARPAGSPSAFTRLDPGTAATGRHRSWRGSGADPRDDGFGEPCRRTA